MSSTEMDNACPAAIVNGEMLKMFIGQRVSTVLKVQHSEGGVLVGQSTDGHQLTIRGTPEVPESHYMHVIGIADNNKSIHAEVCKDFGENFDATSFNGLCKLFVNGKVKDLKMFM